MEGAMYIGKFAITPCETVVLWLSFRAVENRDVFARAYRDVLRPSLRIRYIRVPLLTASLKDNHNTTVIVVPGAVHGLFEKLRQCQATH